MNVRPAVELFAQAMERRLQANDYKGGWEECPSSWLAGRALEEVQEMVDALNSRDLAAVRREAADAANFLMMVFDNAGSPGHGQESSSTNKVSLTPKGGV